jgi:hypothetical protein
MQEKSKIYNIQGKNTNSPSNQAIWMANTIPPPRKSANREESRGLVKMSANCLSVSIYLISMSHFSTCSLRKWCLLSTCLIFLWKTGFLATEMAHEGDSLKLHSKISRGVYYLKNLRAAASSSYILGLGGGLCN